MRYPKYEIVTSELDPFTDCIEWLGGLRSQEAVKQILRERHAMLPPHIAESSKAIVAHTRTALDLIEQAYDGRAQVSYLPLYYAMLNFAKVAIICAGKLNDLMVRAI